MFGEYFFLFVMCLVRIQDSRIWHGCCQGRDTQDQILLSWASCSLGCRLYTVEHNNNIKSENYKRGWNPERWLLLWQLVLLPPIEEQENIFLFIRSACLTDVLLALIGFPPVCLFWVANTISWKVTFCELPQLPCKHFDWAVSDCIWEKGKRYFVLLHTLLITMHHTVSVHCREEGCFGKYIPCGQKISQGQNPKKILRTDTLPREQSCALIPLKVCSLTTTSFFLSRVSR